MGHTTNFRPIRCACMTGLLSACLAAAACDGTIRPWEPSPRPRVQTTPDAAPAESFTLLTTMSDSPAVEQYRAELGFESCFIVSGNAHIDSDHDGIWDGPDAINRYLRARIPERYDGYIVLDWEGPLMNRLRGWRDDNAAAQRSRNNAIELLQHVKAQRPEAKVGYYGLPYRKFWTQGEEWMDDMRWLGPLYDASDALFPSAYDLYDRPDRDNEKYNTMVESWLEVARNKPVLVFTHSRYHQSNKNVGLRTIPEAEFRSHIETIMSADHNGTRAAGIVVWGEDRFWVNGSFRTARNGRDFANTGDKWDYRRTVLNEERLDGESNDAMLDRLHRRNYRLIHESLLRVLQNTERTP